jgi:dihydrofolate reductase
VGTLSYITNVSLDGFIEDADGRFDWSEPSDELFGFITDLVRPIGTWLYGRRLYESMAVWETDPALATQSALMADFAAVWQAGEKIVYSTTLDEVSTGRTRIERGFDPEAVRTMKASAEGVLTIGGAELAAQAFAAGLVDECHVFVHPAFVGGGKLGFPTGIHIGLELVDERRFDNGVVHLHHRVLP